MLPGTGLGDEPRLPKTPREERLTERVVDLVRTGMEKILALEIDARAAQPSRQVVGEVEPRGPPRIALEPAVQLALEARVALQPRIRALEDEQRGHERLGDIAAPVDAEMAARVRQPWRRG